jgi:hypothetical protein
VRSLLAVLLSLRTTAVLLAALAALLVLNVALPQQAVDPETYARAVRSSALARFVLERLGLGSVATSPPFLAVLGGFFLNLTAVLVERTGTTLRRVRVAPPAEAQVAALLAAPAALAGPATPDAGARAEKVLRQLGYRTLAVGERAVWGVKHRFALLGFPLFHAAFFLLFAGSIQLYLTRHVATLLAVEGQPVSTALAAVARAAPLGPPAPVNLLVERVDMRLEDGKPIDLRARIALEGEGEAALSRINSPAVWGPLTVLVEGAGVAPVLWLTDARGFTVDRVLTPAAHPRNLPVEVPLSGGLQVTLKPIPLGPSFPERAALGSAPLRIRVRAGGKDAFEGEVRPGEAIHVGDLTLRVPELRYWASLRLVHERGGGILIGGFVLSIVGIVWRMLLFRRELVVGWDENGVRIAGRGEFFPARFRDELELARDLLAAPDDAAERKAGHG